MKVDRSLVGVVLIALVMSTLVTLFIIGEGGGPYSIVGNQYRRTGGSLVSGVVLLAREPIACLEISQFSLMNRTKLINRTELNVGGGSYTEICERVPKIKTHLEISSVSSLTHETRSFSVNIPIQVDEQNVVVYEEFDLYLYDFSKLVWGAMPTGLMRSMERPRVGDTHAWDYYNVFACLFDEDGNLTYFYVGVADFYCRQLIAIEELTLERNEEKSIYYGTTREGMEEKELSMLDAPARGIVRFEDLEADERVAVSFSVDTGKVDVSQILQIVAICVDQGEPDYLINFLEPTRT